MNASNITTDSVLGDEATTHIQTVVTLLCTELTTEELDNAIDRLNTTATPAITTVAFKTYVWHGNKYLNYAYLFLAVVGLLGNTLIIILMRRPNNSGKSTSVLFTSLAVSDTLFTVNSVVGALRSNNLFSLNDEFNIHAMLWTVNRHVSNWILAAITVERVLIVAYPIKMKDKFTPLNAVIIVVVITVISVIVNVPLWCLLRVFRVIQVEALFYVDIIHGFCLPFLVMLTGSVYIVASLKQRRLQTNGTQLSSTTRILIAANMAFLITMLPRHVLSFFYEDHVLRDLYFLHVLFWLLQECNSVLNFYVYILAGTKFREELKEMFTPRRYSVNASVNASANSPDVENAT